MKNRANVPKARPTGPRHDNGEIVAAGRNGHIGALFPAGPRRNEMGREPATPGHAPEGEMARTGTAATTGTNAVAKREASHAPAGMRPHLLSSLSVVALLVSVALPVTVDTGTMTPAFSFALADNGNGNGNGNGDGQGKGIGNGKGRGDEMGGGNGFDDDEHGDDGENAGPGDDEHGDHGGNTGPGDDDDGPAGNDPPRDPDGGHTGDVDDTGDTQFADEFGGPPSKPLAGPAAPALPTVQEIFSLGEDSVLSAEQELLAIKNGWNLQN